MNQLQRALLRRHVRRRRRDVRDGLAGGRTTSGHRAVAPAKALGMLLPSLDEALARSGAAAELVGAGVGGVRRVRGLPAVGVRAGAAGEFGEEGLAALGRGGGGRIGLGGGDWGCGVGGVSAVDGFGGGGVRGPRGAFDGVVCGWGLCGRARARRGRVGRPTGRCVAGGCVFGEGQRDRWGWGS